MKKELRRGSGNARFGRATALEPGRTSNLTPCIKRFNKQNKPGGVVDSNAMSTKAKIHHGGTAGRGHNQNQNPPRRHGGTGPQPKPKPTTETRRRSKPIFTTEDTT